MVSTSPRALPGHCGPLRCGDAYQKENAGIGINVVQCDRCQTNQDLPKGIFNQSGTPNCHEEVLQIQLVATLNGVASRKDAEEFASTHGFPMNKWDVSNNQDFSFIFEDIEEFNKDNGLWNVLNAISMMAMFCETKSFDHQDIFSRDVSNVTDMSFMISHAINFNQDLLSWITANVSTTRDVS
jgi:hypothetical protein